MALAPKCLNGNLSRQGTGTVRRRVRWAVEHRLDAMPRWNVIIDEVARLPGILTCEGLKLRRGDPIFTEPMISAVRKSFAELQQWMSWAQEMPSVDKLRQVLLKGQMAFDANQAWEYTIFETEAEQRVGGTGLHPSDRPNCFEIAYWVRTDCTGRGIATATTSVPDDAAFTHLGEATQVAIGWTKPTAPSAAIPRYWNLRWITRRIMTFWRKGTLGVAWCGSVTT